MKLISFIALAVTVASTAFVSRPVAAAESTHYLTTVDIIYAESLPNDKEQGTPRGRIKAILKRFDGADNKPASDAIGRKADIIALKDGYTEVPAAAFDAIIRRLEAYHVKAAPVFYSNIRKKEDLEAFKKKLAEKHPPLPNKSDFVLSLVPYQTTYSDSRDVVLWIGALMYDTKTRKNKMLTYLTVPFGTGRKGMDEKDADRLASILIDSLVKDGFLPKDAKTVPAAKS